MSENSYSDSNYDELIKNGYIEEGPLKVDTNHLTGINISSTSFDAVSAPQEGRTDAKTRVVAPDGSITKLTPFVTGRKYQMTNGKYVNATEFAAALEEAVESLEEGSIVVSRTGKVLNPDALFEFAQSVAEVISIGSKVDSMPVEAVSRSITTPDGQKKQFPPAIGGGVKVIKTDNYYFADGLIQALEEFVVLTPPSLESEPSEPSLSDPITASPESLRVSRVDRHWKNRATAWLCAVALPIVLGSGLSIDKIPQKTEDAQLIDQVNLNYKLIEQMREMGLEDEIIKEIFKKFAAKSGFDLGKNVYFGDKTTAHEFGNLTGGTTTLYGDHTITGFCLYSPDNTKYEYSFYEDRNLDGKAERLNVEGIEQKTNLTLSEFLEKLDISNYDLNDIRFSLHFGNKGWVDFSDLIKVTEDTKETTVQKMVEICKDVATYDGTVENFDADFIKIVDADGKDVWIPVTDDNDQLYAPGSRVIGSDGKEYVISQLSLEKEMGENGNTMESEGKTKLSWSIEDCELALAVAPLIAAAGFAIASKIRNEKYKKDPDFFEFEDESDYRKFKEDFEKAREEYRKSSTFGQTLKRVFYGEQVHVATNLTEEQVQKLYTTIVNTHNSDYSYNPNDQIRFQDGQIYAYRNDGTRQNITEAVSHIGSENKNGTEGLLTDEIIQEHGGGTKK